jgi:hypothetical protein
MVSTVQNGALLIWRGRERGYRQQGDLTVYIPFLAGVLVGERVVVKVKERERRQWHPCYGMGHHLFACRVVAKAKARGRERRGQHQARERGCRWQGDLAVYTPFLAGVLVRQRAVARV